MTKPTSCRLDAPAAHFARSAAERLGWSGRRLHRCLKVARTIADLAGSELLATADNAMYAVKAGGHGGFRFSSPPPG